jgi:hypothetical protein
MIPDHVFWIVKKAAFIDDAAQRLHSSPGDQLEDDHDDCDHQQQVDEPAADMKRNKAEQPEDEEDDRDGPKHGDSFLTAGDLTTCVGWSSAKQNA